MASVQRRMQHGTKIVIKKLEPYKTNSEILKRFKMANNENRIKCS